MKFFSLFFVFAGLSAVAPSARAQESRKIRVDVVVDMTDAGRRIEPPTPAKPAYYLPLPVGYKQEGAVLNDQAEPPPDKVEHILAEALARQGYLVMTRQFAPSLVLVIWWGYMAPQLDNTAHSAPHGATHSINITQLPGNGGGGINASGMSGAMAQQLVNELPTDEMTNYDQMISLVAGSKAGSDFFFEDQSPVFDEIKSMTRSPRHYLMVSAFAFQPWLHHHTILLWRAHVSTELWGRGLEEVLPTLITSAAPLFGRETRQPKLVFAPVDPAGHVDVGAPVVRRFPSPAQNSNPDKNP